MAASKILDESMATDHDRRGPICLRAAHWSQPRLETAVVILDPAIRVLLGVMNRFWDQLIDDAQQGRSQIGGDLSGSAMGNHR